MTSTYSARINEVAYEVKIVSARQIEVNGTLLEYDFVRLGDSTFSLILNGRTHRVELATAPNSNSSGQPAGLNDLTEPVQLSIDGIQQIVQVDDSRSLLLKSLVVGPQATRGILLVRAPMPGLISRIEVRAGEHVTIGIGLLVLEAMKMENEIKSLCNGVVQTIHVESGKPVEKGQDLITIAES